MSTNGKQAIRTYNGRPLAFDAGHRPRVSGRRYASTAVASEPWYSGELSVPADRDVEVLGFFMYGPTSDSLNVSSSAAAAVAAVEGVRRLFFTLSFEMPGSDNPRLSRIIPFWFDCHGAPDPYPIVLREPVSVVAMSWKTMQFHLVEPIGSPPRLCWKDP